MSKKLIQAAAGAGGESVYVDDVFSTYLYEGNGNYSPKTGTNTISNGIDLSGEGGLVWARARDTATTIRNMLFDTERGVSKPLYSERTDAQGTYSGYGVTSFNSDGFTLEGNLFGENYNTAPCVSWTFRKQAGFFDVITWTGDGSSTRTLSHNLDANIGAVLIKGLNESEGWVVAHRATSAGNKVLQLNTTSAETTVNHTYISGSTLTVGTAGNPSFSTNDSGINYVAYLFAHDDQSFGDDSDESVIKCGSFTAGTFYGLTGDLGWEPQWFLVKESSGTSNWTLIDNMRGIGIDFNDSRGLRPNTSSAEENVNIDWDLANQGTRGLRLFGAEQDANQTYIYIAIRRPMKTPESGTEVFKPNDVDNGASKPDSLSGFPVDMYFRRYVNTTNDTYLLTRLTSPNALKTNGTDAEAAFSTASAGFDYNDGVMNIFSSNNSDFHTWMFKRATGFFDVICHSGSGYNTNVKHNLGVVPELVISKTRSASGFGSDLDKWYVWSSAVSGSGNNAFGFLNETGTTTNGFFASSPTSTDLYLHGNVAYSGDSLVKYLFATVAGVSKVGSYTGDGTSDSSHVIDCGFSAGARFVMIKRTDSTGDWWVFDTTRGLVAGADTRIALNSTSAEYTGIDDIDPHNSGFIVTNPGGSDLNVNNATYIFLAIA